MLIVKIIEGRAQYIAEGGDFDLMIIFNILSNHFRKNL